MKGMEEGLFCNDDKTRTHHHQPINVPTAGALAFLMDHT
jgi:hypothetical protein